MMGNCSSRPEDDKNNINKSYDLRLTKKVKMFVGKLSKAEPLKKVTAALVEIVSNIEWRITSDKIRIYAMDVSHVCVIDLVIPSSAFLSYSFKSSGDSNELRICVPFNNLAKVLKCIGNDQSMSIKIANQQQLTLTSGDKDDNAREFKLSLLECVEDVPDLDLPDEDAYDIRATFEPSELAALVKDLSSIGDSISIEGADDALRFTTSGEIGTASIKFRKIKMAEDGTLGSFASRYMIAMSKMAGASNDETILCISVGMPMMIKFKITNDFGCIRYFIAPKVVDQEE